MSISTFRCRSEARGLPGSLAFAAIAAMLALLFFQGAYFASSPLGTVTASVQIASSHYESGSLVYTLNGNFSNPTDSDVSIFASRDAAGASRKFVTVLKPRTFSSISFDVSGNLASASGQEGTVSILAYYSDNQSEIISQLALPEPESAPDPGISLQIRNAYGILLPVFLVLFLASMALLASFIKKHSAEASNHGEFTLHSLLIPVFDAKSTLFEKLSVIFANPVLWIDEGLFVLVLLAIIHSQLSAQVGAQEALQIIIFAGIGAGLLPFAYLFGAYLLDFKVAHKPFRFFVAFFMWGAFSAVIAFFANSLLSGIFNFAGFDLASAYGVVFATAVASPLIEEVVKGIGIYLGSRHHAFDSVPTGMLLGFACGIGFSFVENWFYFTSRTTPYELGFAGWVALIIYRSFFNSLSHGIFSGTVGGFIGYIKSHPGFARKYHVGVIPGILFAILLHSIFNSSAIIDTLAISQYNFAFFIFNPFVAVVFNLLFVLVLFMSIKEFWTGSRRAGVKAIN